MVKFLSMLGSVLCKIKGCKLQWMPAWPESARGTLETTSQSVGAFLNFELIKGLDCESILV